MSAPTTWVDDDLAVVHLAIDRDGATVTVALSADDARALGQSLVEDAAVAEFMPLVIA